MSEKEFWLLFFEDGKRQISDTAVSPDTKFYQQTGYGQEPKNLVQVVHVVEYSEPTKQDINNRYHALRTAIVDNFNGNRDWGQLMDYVRALE